MGKGAGNYIKTPKVSIMTLQKIEKCFHFLLVLKVEYLLALIFIFLLVLS